MSTTVTVALAVGALVVLVAAVALRVADRLGLPSLLIYLGIGLAIGDAGLGIRFSDAALTQSLGLTALAVILAEGGLTARWDTIRPALGPAALLSTVGVVVSVAVTAVIAHWVLATDWRTAILLGAVVSCTDAAAVFSVLRRLPLRGGSQPHSRPSRVSTTRRSSCWSRWLCRTRGCRQESG